jgi:glucosamine--fructose-6-phosphate aminotransferase (isomerizing)
MLLAENAIALRRTAKEKLMCGIIGYSGPRNAKDVVLDALERMEYRGYDSAGLALNSAKNGGLIVEKAAGRLFALKEKIKDQELCGKSAIGHTRWATHGAPSDINAHPQKYGRVTLVHNGIFDNYAELKHELKNLGHIFSSHTDTEIAAHLLDNLLKEGHEPLKAIHILCGRLKGLFALGILIEDDLERVYFAKRGAPLLVAHNKEESFFASDQAALVSWQPSFYALNDSEMGFIEKNKIAVFNEEGKEVFFTLSPLKARRENIEKQNHAHFMHKEIFEQPDVIDRVLQGRIKDGMLCLDGFELDFSHLDTIEKIQIIACGSSYFAGLIAKQDFETFLGLPTEVEIASEYRYRHTLTNENTLVIAISQSGETADTAAALEKALKMGAKALALSNVVGSHIANRCALSMGSLMLNAGPEISVASTKAFVAQVVALKLLTISFARYKQQIDIEQEFLLIKNLLTLKEHIRRILKLDDEIKNLAHYLKDEPHMLFVARGELVPIALEGALKMKELAYIFAEGYAAGELKHGPIATIEPKTPVIVLFNNDHVAAKTANNVQEMKARGATIINIAPCDAQSFCDNADFMIDLGPCDSWLVPIAATIVVQLLAYHVSVLKGLDVDKPRNLAKSVTVE